MFNIGDYVSVLSTGPFYTTYESYFKKNGLNQYREAYAYDKCPPLDHIYYIVATGPASVGPMYILRDISDGSIYMCSASLPGCSKPAIVLHVPPVSPDQFYEDIMRTDNI